MNLHRIRFFSVFLNSYTHQCRFDGLFWMPDMFAQLYSKYKVTPYLLASLVTLSGCGDSSSTTPDDLDADTTPFTLNFSASSQGVDVGCDQFFTGFGPSANNSIGIGDLRFYVSNLRFRDFNDDVIDVQLADNDFQLNHSAGSVALIDFLGTGNSDSSVSDLCNAVSESTARTNTQITGRVSDDQIASIEFDVGVPQSLMQAVIQSGSAEDAPSPLNEMYWSWASGYRHLVANFTMMNATYTSYVNNSAFHIGSRDCDGGSGKALTDEDSCGLVNTAKVVISDFDPSTDTINLDIEAAFTGLLEADIISSEWAKIGSAEGEVDESTCLEEPVDHGGHGRWCIIGETYGSQCHSASTQSACTSLFPNFGLDLDTGAADATSNNVFTKKL